MTTNPAGVELSAPAAYQNKLIGLLAGRKPLEVLRETPGVFAALLRDVSPATLRRRPYPDRWTWTPLEIIGHLCDTEIVFGFRMRLILAQDRPPLTPMDQDQWVAAQRYNDRDPAELLETFRALRAVNTRLWEEVKPPDFERVGLHAERGPESLGLMLKMEAGHDLSHVEQMKKYLNALQ